MHEAQRSLLLALPCPWAAPPAAPRRAGPARTGLWGLRGAAASPWASEQAPGEPTEEPSLWPRRRKCRWTCCWQLLSPQLDPEPQPPPTQTLCPRPHGPSGRTPRLLSSGQDAAPRPRAPRPHTPRPHASPAMLANISLMPMSTYWGTCHQMGRSAAKYTTLLMVWFTVLTRTRSSRLLSRIPARTAVTGAVRRGGVCAHRVYLIFTLLQFLILT